LKSFIENVHKKSASSDKNQSIVYLINPKIMKNCQKTSVFGQEFEDWSFYQSSNLTSVETKWSHKFIEKLRHLSSSLEG